MSEPFFLDTPEARDRLGDRIKSLPIDDKHQWEVIIKRKREARTNLQLRLYWRWLRLIATHTGMSPEQVDLALRRKHCPVEIALEGESFIIPGDVSGYDIKEYGQYLDWVREFSWAEFAIDLPLPPRKTPQPETEPS